jgi:alkylation response protein AidB-like acyl-CoA dehydrogenase
MASSMSDTTIESFRAEVAEWLGTHCPAAMREPALDDEDMCFGGRNWVFQSTAQRSWLEAMVARGWTAPEWPTVYGGGGLSHDRAKVLSEEMSRLGCRPPLVSFGIWMLGPALLRYGSEEQRREYLPPIVRGEIRWCQGYSEPGAGSDLASLATRAEDRGDHFLVNGRKIWTSYADRADWIFCLVRTDPTANKHIGISFLLIDMTSPGVSTRPITLISGKSPFCETLFEEVRVPKRNLVHEINRGWDVAKYLLTHERAAIAELMNKRDLPSIGVTAAQTVSHDAPGPALNPILRARMAEFDVDALAFQYTLERINDLAQAGKAPAMWPSLVKYYGAELNKRRHELLMSAGGAEWLEWESPRSQAGLTAREWLRSKGNSIEGGTSEIQLNIIAKRALELPNA